MRIPYEVQEKNLGYAQGERDADSLCPMTEAELAKRSIDFREGWHEAFTKGLGQRVGA